MILTIDSHLIASHKAQAVHYGARTLWLMRQTLLAADGPSGLRAEDLADVVTVAKRAARHGIIVLRLTTGY